MKKIYIGSDHAGYDLKEKLKVLLVSMDFEILDQGTNDNGSCDYPDYARPVAEAVDNGLSKFGIVICGSANGVCMTANKHQGVRAALCWTAEIAELARLHNDANVLCLPARYLNEGVGEEILKTFLNTNFEGGRHQRRVEKISLSVKN